MDELTSEQPPQNSAPLSTPPPKISFFSREVIIAIILGLLVALILSPLLGVIVIVVASAIQGKRRGIFKSNKEAATFAAKKLTIILGSSFLIIIAVLGALSLYMLGFFSASPVSSCLPVSGNICQNLKLQSGILSFTFGSNVSIYNATLTIANASSSINPATGLPFASGTCNPQRVSINSRGIRSFTCQFSQLPKVGRVFYGLILANYTNSAGFPLSSSLASFRVSAT